MRRITVLTLWVLALSTPALMANAETKEEKDGMDIYFRDTSLLSTSKQDLPKYSSADPGDSKRIDRAWESAPPSIPHTIEDMYPLQIGNNECLDCHSPENAISKDDLPLSDTHFETPQMGDGSGGMINTVTSYKKGKEINMARYNCDMCHVPLASNVKTPNSKFAKMKVDKGL